MVHQAVFGPTAERQMARLGSAGFDPRQTGVVDGNVRLDPAVPNDQDWVNYLKVGVNRIDIEVDVKSRGLLVLSEAATPVLDYSPWPVYCGGALSLGAIIALLFGRRLFVRHVQRIS